MITLIYGENAFERDFAVKKRAGDAIRYDGATIDKAQLQQLLYGVSLFNLQQSSIIDGLSEQKALWEWLGDTLTEADVEATTIILLETKVDKRTKTYKLLKKYADVIECVPFTERDTARVITWLQGIAKEHSIVINTAAAKELVQRIGVDQYRLLHELTRLSALGEAVTVDTVVNYTPQTPRDTAFNLLEVSLIGTAQEVRAAVRAAHITNDPYMTVGLLVSQLYALSGLVFANGMGLADIAKELGVHPFVLRNLQRIAKKITEEQLCYAVAELVEVDTQLKTSDIDPWLAIEIALLAIASRSQR